MWKTENYTGFVAFDFIIDQDDVPYPLECNPRLTSGIHFLHHGDLAAALLDPNKRGPIRFNPHNRLQEGHTSLTKAYAAILRPQRFFKRLGLVLTTRDVLWSLRDPLPFLLMTPMSWPILSAVLFRGLSFGEAAMQDIAWHPPEQPDGTGSVAGNRLTATPMESLHETAV